jgi:lambda family phage tail tape measure protein
MNDVENATDRAGDALEKFAQGPAKKAADDTAKAFELAGNRIANALERAALRGEFSFRDLAATITNDLARLALNDLLLTPLQNALQGAFGGGATGGGGINPVSVVMNISGVSDVGGFRKNQSQISSSLARAVAQGQKFT